MRTGAAATRSPGVATTIAQVSDLPVPAPAGTVEAAPGKPEDLKLGFAPATKPGASSAPAAGAKAAAPTPAPEPTAAPAPPPAPTAAPPAPTPVPKAAKKTGPYFVQVLATQKADVADEMNKKLRADGFPSDVTPVPNKAGWFRVRVGPYPDRAKADAAAGKIQKAEKTKNRPIVVP